MLYSALLHKPNCPPRMNFILFLIKMHQHAEFYRRKLQLQPPILFKQQYPFTPSPATAAAAAASPVLNTLRCRCSRLTWNTPRLITSDCHWWCWLCSVEQLQWLCRWQQQHVWLMMIVLCHCSLTMKSCISPQLTSSIHQLCTAISDETISTFNNDSHIKLASVLCSETD